MRNTLTNIRIARVSTIPFFIFTQLRSQLEMLSSAGAEVCVIASDDELASSMQMIHGCCFEPVFIAREIRPIADLFALIKLWRLFRKERFQIVHSTTPKAGLLCAIAAKLAGVPVRIHTFTGQPWVTMSGLKKHLVKWSDKLITALNTVSYTDSFSQRTFLIDNKIASSNKIKVLGSGSLAGVDVQRFSLERFSFEENQRLKASLNIDESTKILLFVGRVTKDKGIFELLDAMHSINALQLNVVLLIIGPFEQHNEEEVKAYAKKLGSDAVRFLGFQSEPERYIAIADLLCLPSYREGFGTVVIEAAAMRVPTVGTNIYGLSDAVVDGVTGLLVEPKDDRQLADAIKTLVIDDALRIQLGEQARVRALAEFDTERVNLLLVDEYKRLLDDAGR